MRKKFYVLDGSETVAKAARLMKEKGLGSLGVNLSDGSLGILTDRDVVYKVVAEGKDPSSLKLEDVATPHPVSVTMDASLEQAMKLMRDNNILRLVVVDPDGRPVGLLVERWVFLALANELLGRPREGPRGWLEQYINDVTEAAAHDLF